MDTTQRLQLGLLFRVLDKLDPKQGWDRDRRIVEEGLESEYRSLTEHLDDPIAASVTEDVHGFFSMFEALRDSIKAQGIADKDVVYAATFRGFDLNASEEARYARVAEYLFSERRWESFKSPHGINSHRPKLSDYRSMYARFRPLDAPGRDYRTAPLTEAEVRSIVA